MGAKLPERLLSASYSMGSGDSSLGSKADSAEVNNAWSYISTPLYVFMA
jgi:hypothetical protein